MKLRKLHIEDYKMFKDFDIDFLDENDNALDIVVLAGVNGSGKTTIFELLNNLLFHQLEIVLEKKIISFNPLNSLVDMQSLIGLDKSKRKEVDEWTKVSKVNFDLTMKFIDSLVYFPSGIDDTKKVAEEFVKTFYFFLKEKDYRPSEITEYFNQYMKDIFNDLDIGFKYSHLDKEDKVWFTSDDSDGYYYTHKDNKEKVLFSIDELSTGQKTLLSKILYIYFKDYKDKVILIDEPELSLHPKWQNQVLSVYDKLVEKNNCQIIIATHSPHIIGSAKPEYLRVLKKVNNKIEVAKYTKSYGLEFNKILTDIMGAETRVSDISERLSKIKSLIIQNDFNSDEFKTIWSDLEGLLGVDNIDLRLLKLEIASRKKNVSNN